VEVDNGHDWEMSEFYLVSNMLVRVGGNAQGEICTYRMVAGPTVQVCRRCGLLRLKRLEDGGQVRPSAIVDPKAP